MTEEELDILHKEAEAFYIAFSVLVAESLKAVPKDLRELHMMRLQEKASIYGSAYHRYMR
jgi:hypothetical protein